MRKYSSIQIALHWAVVLMIAVQWWTAAAIPRTHSPLLPPSAWDLFQHKVHNYSGMTIGALIALRVALRLVRGTRERPGMSNWMDRAAAFVHWGLYAALVAQAFTGFVTSYYWGPVAGVHKAIWNVTLALISIHVAAAVWHGFRRDEVLSRMLPWKQAYRI